MNRVPSPIKNYKIVPVSLRSVTNTNISDKYANFLSEKGSQYS